MTKNIDESRLLMKFSKMLGQEPDPMIVRQVKIYDELQEQVKKIEARMEQQSSRSSNKYLQDVFKLFSDLQKVQHTIVEQRIDPSSSNMPSVQQIAEEMSKYVKVAEDFQQPQIPQLKDLDALSSKVRMIEQWVTNISSTGPGGGEVNFRYLDDVARSTMTPTNDNWVLEYNAASKKVQFTTDIGPIESVQYDPNHIDEHAGAGITCWNASDRTLNIHHPGGVVQQIGQEQYMLVRNNTGSMISNGTCVRFDGATGTDGEARILTAPLLADGTFPTLYVIGIATQDIADGEEGFITTYGKVRSIDTTGSDVGESWSVGDILYANPVHVGKLTKVKPTAPNNCIPIAAALNIDATEGEIVVRPTIDQRMIYGRFSDTTDHVPLAIDTPYAITFNTTNISNGVVRGSPTSRIVVDQSGFYEIKASFSLTSTNSSAKAFYCWIRKNGVDVPYSARRKTIIGNGTYDILTRNFAISLDANDYVEIMYAASDIAIGINAPPATAFCPAIPSITATVTQVAL